MNLAFSAIALILGLFIAVAPARAARVWNPQRLEKLPPRQKVWFLRAYRALGVVLTLTALLFALDSLPLSR
jgi:hypothetical protein